MAWRVFAKCRVEQAEYGTGACTTDSIRTRVYGKIKQGKYPASHLDNEWHLVKQQITSCRACPGINLITCALSMLII